MSWPIIIPVLRSRRTLYASWILIVDTGFWNMLWELFIYGWSRILGHILRTICSITVSASLILKVIWINKINFIYIITITVGIISILIKYTEILFLFSFIIMVVNMIICIVIVYIVVIITFKVISIMLL